MSSKNKSIPKLEHISLTETSIINIWAIDKEFRYTFFNENHKNDMKTVWGADIKVGKNLIEYLPESDYRDDVLANYKSILNGKTHRSKDHFTLENGEELFFENFGQAVRDNKGDVTGVMFYSVNITQQTELENRLKLSISLLKSIMNSPDMIHILSIDKEYRYLFFNNAHKRAMQQVWNTTPEIGTNVFEFLPDETHRKRVKNFYDRALNGEICRSQSEMINSQGERLIFDNISAPIFNTENEISGITIFTINITEKEEAVELINESLTEKEVLLKEIHHRVKNNFQIISSMISLQLHHENDARITSVLQDSLNRLSTMSEIHQLLYQGDDLARISMKPYCDKLIGSILQLFGEKAHGITIDINVGNISLDLEQAIPLVLIINELVTNSLKYAFEGKSEGLISLRLKENGEKYHLRIKDNGVGLDSTENNKSGSIGIELIKVFTEQLEGTVEFISDKGLTVDVFFPKQAD